MTKQEIIFEVAKTLYFVDKTACYEQLQKINFDELSITFGRGSGVEIDIRNLVTFLALSENIGNITEINTVNEISRIKSSPNTKMFYDNKHLAAYLLKLAKDKDLISEAFMASLKLNPSPAAFIPNIIPTTDFYDKTTVLDINEHNKIDITSLVNMFYTKTLTKAIIDNYVPAFDEISSFLKLKIDFASTNNLFDYGANAINEFLTLDEFEYSSVYTFIDQNIDVRGSNDEKLQAIISKVRSKVSKTYNEMKLDIVLFMHEYKLKIAKSANIDLNAKLKNLIKKYSDLKIDTKELVELNKLKGI